MSALDDRRQAAREAAQDSAMVVQSWALNAIEVAIETATRVRVTPEIVVAFEDQERGRCCDCGSNTLAGLRAAFVAAGFEVEE